MGPSAARVGARATASEAAYILRQVLRVWTVDYRNARYHDVTLSLRMPASGGSGGNGGVGGTGASTVLPSRWT